MKFRFIPAALITASALAAAPALAQTSADQRGEFTVPYACSVSPVTAAMNINNNQATGSGTGNYSQNSNTKYSLSALSLSGPIGTNPGNYTGEIDVTSQSGTALVFNQSKTAQATGNTIPDLQSTGFTTRFLFQTNENTFRAGNYAVAATLTCAQVES